ncbi:MAG: S41 family peptidase [Reichenbachiella sp.]
MKRVVIGFLSLSLLIGLFSFTYYQDNEFEITRNLNIFTTLYRELNTHYVDELPTEEIINSGIQAMLSSLDPYTNYIPESELENYRTTTTGEYGGIGAVVSKRKGINTVLMPYIGFPAHKAGLLIGDQIVKINGKEIDKDSNQHISTKLKGQPGTSVVLTIKRQGKEELFEVKIVRKKIVISNLAYFGMFNEDVGYMRLSDFTTNAGKEVEEALVQLKSQGAEKIVLDLRDNPGGLLDEAVKVANVFVPKGKEIVSTKGKVKSWEKTYKSPFESIDENIPLVILTNGNTASAAEIVSGVIQDYDRGVLIGTRTFGKGLVQATRPLPFNSQLKVTTAKYYIPSGRCIQAIDYSIKNENGSVGTIPDSVKIAYKTSNGRTVYDGGGIMPDIEVEPDEYSNLLYNILNDHFMFDYAGKYYLSHPSIAAARDFRLTDAEYLEFVNWLEGKEVSFSSQMDRAIESLEKMAKDEKYYEGIDKNINELKEKVEQVKKNYLIEFKSEVKMALEQEIVSRYYFHQGIVEAGVQKDGAIAKAANLLNNPEAYNNLLK